MTDPGVPWPLAASEAITPPRAEGHLTQSSASALTGYAARAHVTEPLWLGHSCRCATDLFLGVSGAGRSRSGRKGRMLTSSTAEIRTWARSEGLTVADRGRLAPAILAAHAAVQQPIAKPVRATSGKAASKKGASNTPAVASSSAATRKPTTQKPTAVKPTTSGPSAESVSAGGPAQVPDPHLGQDKIDALWEVIEALAARISALESSALGKKRFPGLG